jgi:predicted glutamine amidotransferase
MERHGGIQHPPPQPDVKSPTIAGDRVPPVRHVGRAPSGARHLLAARRTRLARPPEPPEPGRLRHRDVRTDTEFAREAREECSTTFLAHVRYASVGGLSPENTHPFVQDGRAFAHNGHLEGLETLDARLGDARSLVHGQTDSERFFALITSLVRGDVGAGIVAAATWIAAELPLRALNCIVATPTELWALRYPDTNKLYVLERPGGRYLDAASAAGRIRVRSGDMADTPSVLIATEPMDEHPEWRLLEPGELLHVDPDLRVTSRLALPDPPAHPLSGLPAGTPPR